MSNECCFGSEDLPAPELDNTPVGRYVKPGLKGNFVIILAGPGKYNSKDRDHDQYWGNYFVAAQHVFGDPKHPKQFNPEVSLPPGEDVHWLVYEKAYRERWVSDKDSKIDFLIKEAAKYERFKNGYIDRVKEYITQLDKKAGGGRHKYIAMDSFKDVWETLHAMPDKSLTRLYYFGHGGPNAFYLRWARDFSRSGQGVIYGNNTAEETVSSREVDTYKGWLALKARPGDGHVSRFYACTSADWARKWNAVTKLKSEGSETKISFSKIREDKDLRGLEESGTWKAFP